MDAQELLDRAEYTIEYQKQEINRLRAEVDRLLGWINGDADALTTLQSVYLNPDETAGNRTRAAAAAIGYERPKMVATSLVVVDFRERVRQARLKAAFVEPKTIEHIPAE